MGEEVVGELRELRWLEESEELEGLEEELEEESEEELEGLEEKLEEELEEWMELDRDEAILAAFLATRPISFVFLALFLTWLRVFWVYVRGYSDILLLIVLLLSLWLFDRKFRLDQIGRQQLDDWHSDESSSHYTFHSRYVGDLIEAVSKDISEGPGGFLRSIWPDDHYYYYRTWWSVVIRLVIAVVLSPLLISLVLVRALSIPPRLDKNAFWRAYSTTAILDWLFFLILIAFLYRSEYTLESALVYATIAALVVIPLLWSSALLMVLVHATRLSPYPRRTNTGAKKRGFCSSRDVYQVSCLFHGLHP